MIREIKEEFIFEYASSGYIDCRSKGFYQGKKSVLNSYSLVGGHTLSDFKDSDLNLPYISCPLVFSEETKLYDNIKDLNLDLGYSFSRFLYCLNPHNVKDYYIEIGVKGSGNLEYGLSIMKGEGNFFKSSLNREFNFLNLTNKIYSFYSISLLWKVWLGLGSNHISFVSQENISNRYLLERDKGFHFEELSISSGLYEGISNVNFNFLNLVIRKSNIGRMCTNRNKSTRFLFIDFFYYNLVSCFKISVMYGDFKMEDSIKIGFFIFFQNLECLGRVSINFEELEDLDSYSGDLIISRGGSSEVSKSSIFGKGLKNVRDRIFRRKNF